MSPGTRVEVRSRFDERWARGFEIAAVEQTDNTPHYRLRRRSDGSVLPVLFVGDDVREERHKPMWWI